MRPLVLAALLVPACHPRGSFEGVVEDKDGNLVGYISAPRRFPMGSQPPLSFFDGQHKLRWRRVDLHDLQDSATAILDGGEMFLALFSRAGSGAVLMGVDARTGQRRWTADSRELSAPRAGYHNQVSLELRGATIVMRHHESDGRVVQIFDRRTGRRVRE
jgi:hypothetical protein